MVTITEISRVRSSACISLDTGERYWVREDDLLSSPLSEGSSFEEEAFLREIRLLQYPRALNAAVAMLSRRPCSTGEIRMRLLQKRYMEDTADLVLYKLEKEKLLDDRDFCRQWAGYRRAKNFGPAVIRRELKMKGIPEEMIEEALQETDPEEEAESAVALASKAWRKIRSGEDIRKSRQKVIASLVRKGYGWGEAKAACEAAEKETE